MSPEESKTFELLRQILTKDFEVAPELIHPAARLDQLSIDSLAVIEVMFRLEDEFKVSFPQDPGDLSTVGDLASSIDRLVAEQRAQVPSGAAAP